METKQHGGCFAVTIYSMECRGGGGIGLRRVKRIQGEMMRVGYSPQSLGLGVVYRLSQIIDISTRAWFSTLEPTIPCSVTLGTKRLFMFSSL